MRGTRLHIFFAALAWIFLSASQTAKSQTDVRALALQAQNEQQAGDLAAAERDYKAALAADPGFAELHMNLGLLYQLQNRQAEAMTEFERALKLQPRLAGANFFLGVDYCKSGEGAKAIPYLTAAAKEQPNRKEIWMWLASADEMAMRTPARAATLQHALQLFPDDIDVQYELGTAYEKLGEAAVLEIQKKDPPSFRAEELLGESYAASSEWPVAVLHFQNAIALASTAQGLHAELGEVQLHAGNWQAAQQAFDEELKLNPHSVRALSRRGETELVQNNIAGALQDWTQALPSIPHNCRGFLALGRSKRLLRQASNCRTRRARIWLRWLHNFARRTRPHRALRWSLSPRKQANPRRRMRVPRLMRMPRAALRLTSGGNLMRELNGSGRLRSPASGFASRRICARKAAAALFDAGKYQESLEILAAASSNRIPLTSSTGGRAPTNN